MKKLFLVFLVVLIPFMALAYPNEPKGYQGAEWGQARSTIEGLTPAFNADGFRYFTRSGDPQSFGSASLKTTYYGFKRDKLARVTLISNSFEPLRVAAFTLYGPAVDPFGTSEYYWIGPIAALYLGPGEGSTGVLVITSAKMLEGN